MKFANVDFQGGMILKLLIRFSFISLTVKTDVQAVSRNYTMVCSLVIVKTKTTFVLTEHRYLNDTTRHCTALSYFNFSMQVVRLLLGKTYVVWGVLASHWT
jgi:hypothetical protein